MKKTTKKNSTTRKLLPAFAMLAVSAVTLSTSTYAWFSLNTTVDVRGLTMTVNADSTYLLINTTSTDFESTAAVYKTSTTSSAAAQLAPCAHNPKTGDVIVASTANVTNTSTAAYGNWYKAEATAPDTSTMKAGTAEALTGYEGYVLHETYYIALAAGSTNASDLKVTASTCSNATSGKTNEAVKVLVTTSQDVSEQCYTGTTGSKTWTTDSTTVLYDTVSTTPIAVDVYVYYDGNDPTVRTNNSANLDGAIITLTFGVTPGTSA